MFCRLVVVVLVLDNEYVDRVVYIESGYVVSHQHRMVVLMEIRYCQHIVEVDVL